MPRNRSTTVVASPALAAETVVCSMADIELPAGATVDLEASVDLSIGTAGTTTTLRIRRGTTTAGTLVGSAYGPFTTAAASRFALSMNAVDVLAAESYNLTYVLTVQVANASAQSTVNAAYIWCIY